MKRLLIITLFILLASAQGFGQRWKLNRVEAFGGFTTYHYFGDIGGSADRSTLFGLKDISIRSVRPGFSAGVVYRVQERLYAKGYFSLGLFAQSDKGSRNEKREFAFSTLANEISLQAMFFIIPESDNYFFSVMQLRGGLKEINQPLSLYLFSGLGGIFFYVNENQKLIDRLIRDNDYNRYTPFAVVIPVGIGAKLAFLPGLSAGAELGGRFVLSDYLDGFSPAPSKFNDVYYMVNFKLYYKFPKSKRLRGMARIRF